jgi:hypothetical protein
VRVAVVGVLLEKVATVEHCIRRRRRGMTLGYRWRSAERASKVPDHFATTTVATLLPIVLQVAMAIERKR